MTPLSLCQIDLSAKDTVVRDGCRFILTTREREWDLVADTEPEVQ